MATNYSGLAILKGSKFKTQLVCSDEQIIELCILENTDLVTIDAPPNFSRRGNLRGADLSLIKRGLRVFPPTFGGMRLLTERGIKLTKKLCTRKIRVIEVHPRTSSIVLFRTSDRTP